jgi:sRNA-binding protein
MVKQMSIDTTPSQVATNALQGIPFSQIIGSPLKAAIEAQTMAAQTTWKFIQEVGLNTDEKGNKTAVNVSFDFLQNGKMARLNVPLLTIVPIPYIAINSIDIAFKAKINAESSTHTEASESSDTSASGKFEAKIGWGPFSAKLEASASYSSKKDSKATQDSKYSVEYTLDIAVKAGQESMPAGLARVLDILNNSLSVNEPKGELAANVYEEDGKLKLVATYINGDGLFIPQMVTMGSAKPEKIVEERNAVFSIEESQRGQEIEVKAGEAVRKVMVPKKKEESPE